MFIYNPAAGSLVYRYDNAFSCDPKPKQAGNISSVIFIYLCQHVNLSVSVASLSLGVDV
jgi:hypothetical protein